MNSIVQYESTVVILPIIVELSSVKGLTFQYAENFQIEKMIVVSFSASLNSLECKTQTTGHLPTLKVFNGTFNCNSVHPHFLKSEFYKHLARPVNNSMTGHFKATLEFYKNVSPIKHIWRNIWSAIPKFGVKYGIEKKYTKECITFTWELISNIEALIARNVL